jgi:ABC-type enterochelin transport system permease subunit
VGASTAGIVGLLLWHGEWPVHPQVARFGLAAAVFGMTAWRRRRSEEHFWGDLRRSVGLGLALWPLAVMASACMFIVFSAVTDLLGISHDIVGPVVFYGIFYFPLATMLVLFERHQAAHRLPDADSMV